MKWSCNSGKPVFIDISCCPRQADRNHILEGEDDPECQKLSAIITNHCRDVFALSILYNATKDSHHSELST